MPAITQDQHSFNYFFAMKQFHVFVFTTILLLTSAVYFSCRKPIVLDDTDQGFPIQLNGAIDGDSIRLNWANKRVTNFQRVVVLSSETPISVGLSPFAGPKIELNSTNSNIKLPLQSQYLFSKIKSILKYILKSTTDLLRVTYWK